MEPWRSRNNSNKIFSTSSVDVPVMYNLRLVERLIATLCYSEALLVDRLIALLSEPWWLKY